MPKLEGEENWYRWIKLEEKVIQKDEWMQDKTTANIFSYNLSSVIKLLIHSWVFMHLDEMMIPYKHCVTILLLFSHQFAFPSTEKFANFFHSSQTPTFIPFPHPLDTVIEITLPTSSQSQTYKPLLSQKEVVCSSIIWSPSTPIITEYS